MFECVRLNGAPIYYFGTNNKISGSVGEGEDKLDWEKIWEKRIILTFLGIRVSQVGKKDKNCTCVESYDLSGTRKSSFFLSDCSRYYHRKSLRN
jgi:hypothetical protein